MFRGDLGFFSKNQAQERYGKEIYEEAKEMLISFYVCFSLRQGLVVIRLP
jgi:hypothetical protein